MSRAIQVVWWIGLIGAVTGAAAVLKQVALVLKALREIHQLAQLTRDAARQLASNLSATSRLSKLSEPADALRESAVAASAAARTLEQKLGVATAARTRPGG